MRVLYYVTPERYPACLSALAEVWSHAVAPTINAEACCMEAARARLEIRLPC